MAGGDTSTGADPRHSAVELKALLSDLFSQEELESFIRDADGGTNRIGQFRLDTYAHLLDDFVSHLVRTGVAGSREFWSGLHSARPHRQREIKRCSRLWIGGLALRASAPANPLGAAPTAGARSVDSVSSGPGTGIASGSRMVQSRRGVRISFLSIVIILIVVFGIMPHTSPMQEPAAWAFRIAISLLAGLAAGALTGTIGFKNPFVRAGGGAAFAVFVLVTSTHATSEKVGAAVSTPPVVRAAVSSPEFNLPGFQRSVERWGQLLPATRGNKGGFRCARFGARPEQPWTTAQVLTAYLSKPGSLSATDADVVATGIHYLNSTRLSSGGWPLWESGKIAITEIAAWAALARIRALGVAGILHDKQREQFVKDLKRDLMFIAGRQVASGGWAPVGVRNSENVCTYSTVMSIWALLEASNSKALGDSIGFDTQLRLGINWLLNEAYSTELGGWVPRPPIHHTKRYSGLTAQTLVILLRAKEDPRFAYLHQSERLKRAVSAVLTDASLLTRDQNDNETVDGEDAVMTNAGFSIEGSTFLWVPWTMVLAARAAHDPDFSRELRSRATRVFEHVANLSAKVDFENQGTYWAAEYAICGSEAVTLMIADATDR